MAVIKVGDVLPSNKHGDFTVIEKLPKMYYIVKFHLTGYECCVRSSDIKKGLVKDYNSPTVQGVGYCGKGKYTSTIVVNGKKVKTREYTLWTNVMRRCYDPKFLSKHPAYEGCSVSKVWHCFQDFCESLPTVPGYDQWIVDSSYELDKDGLIDGNKVYSPTTCQFITQKENLKLMTDKRYNKG